MLAPGTIDSKKLRRKMRSLEEKTLFTNQLLADLRGKSIGKKIMKAFIIELEKLHVGEILYDIVLKEISKDILQMNRNMERYIREEEYERQMGEKPIDLIVPDRRTPYKE
jgi:hypothetical protein